MERRNVNILAKLDWLTVLLCFALMVCGWFSICGASADVDSTDLLSFATRPGKQMVWIICTFVIGAVMLSLTANFYNSYSYIFYFAFLLLLLVTIFVAEETKGSRSWLHLGPVSLQPAEFAKFATALALAKYMDRYEFNSQRMGDLIKAAAFFMIPCLLIICQNETGSALVYVAFLLVLYREGMSGFVLFLAFCAILFFILGIKFGQVPFGSQPFSVGTWLVLTIIQIMTAILAGMVKRDRILQRILLCAGVGGMLLGLAFSIAVIPFKVTWLQIVLIVATGIFLIFRALKDMIRPYILVVAFSICSVGYLFSVDYVFNDILRDHQRTRINVILGLEDDPHGAGYNVNQSKIAIGSGGLTGKGFMKGTQTKLKYVPEQDTDFIFCTVGEEQGFKGSVFVLLLYASLLLRLLFLAERQSSVFGRVYGYSVVCILFFHLFINIGMVLGITPVIGIPLPFFSYGGSSLWGFTILLSVFLRIDCERQVSY